MKTIIITGISYGVGKSLVKKFLENNFYVIGTTRSLARLENLNEKNLEVYELGSYKIEDLNNFYEKIKNKKIDIIVNNATMSGSRNFIKDDSIADWQNSFHMNVIVPVYLSKLFMPKMIENKGGHIITINSISSKIPYRGGAHYSSSKRAQSSFSETLRIENSFNNIKVTQVIPAAISKSGEIENSLMPEDIADTVFWIANLPEHVNVDEIEISNIKNTKY